MAFLKSKPPAEKIPQAPPVPTSPGTATVPPIHDDPEIFAAVALVTQLSEGTNRLAREKEMMALEWRFGPGATESGVMPGGERDRRERARLALLQAELAANTAATTKAVQPHNDPAIAAALGVLGGDPLPPRNDRVARLQDLARKTAIIDTARRSAIMRRDELLADRSRDLSMALRPRHDAQLAEIYRAALALSRLVDAERDFRASLIAKGYDPAPDQIGALNMGSLLLLGSERVWDSEISTIRRQLEDRGII